MKAAAAEVLPDQPSLATTTRPKKLPRERKAAKKQPPYAVVLHNDDLNTFEYVIGVLRKVFHYDYIKAYRLTLQADVTGRSVVWSGSLEVAELKADQMRSCGPDPSTSSRGALPLRVTIEPLPE
jgi:ATP-dependent Clp protease adaptor protein ClpS